MRAQNTFSDIIYSAFCRYLGVSSKTDRVEIKKDEKFEQTKQIYIYQLPFKSLVIAAPSFYSQLQVGLTSNRKKTEATAIKRILKIRDFEIQDVYYFFYLDPKNFVLLPPPKFCSIRELGSNDAQVFRQFWNACSDSDRQAGAVSLNDSVCFACFHNWKIGAVATYSFWGELLADIAVLTRPSFRKKGLGKAVLSALCRWGMQNNRISQYCCSKNNSVSISLATSLKFEKLIELERLMLKHPNNSVIRPSGS